MKTFFATFCVISSIVCFIPVYTADVLAGCIQVTCYCRVQLPCGSSNEDCVRACGDAVPPTPTPSSGNPSSSYQRPSYDPMEEQRLKELRRQQFEAEMERRRKEAEEARVREANRRKKFDRDKEAALDMLKSGSEKLGLKRSSGNDIQLKGASKDTPKLKSGTYQAPIFSKGYKESTPVDLRSKSLNKTVLAPSIPTQTEKGKRKGLKTGYVPKPALSSLSDYHYDRKSRTDIVLDALEVGRGDLLRSVGHLESYLLRVNPDNVKVQEALSYIQGMAEGEYVLKERGKEKKVLFDPSANDSRFLGEAISRKRHYVLPGLTANLDQATPPNPLDWREIRNSIVAETFEALDNAPDQLTRVDLERGIEIITKRQKEYSRVNGYGQALQFFNGLMTQFR